MQGRKSLFRLVSIIFVMTSLAAKLPIATGNPPHQGNLQVITAENVDRLTQIGRLGNGRAVSAEFTADGQTLVVLGTLGIWLYDQADHTAPPRLLESSHGGPHSMAVHPIEDTLAMGNRDGTISFWDIESGTETSNIQAHQTPVRLLAYNADGTRLASAGGGVFDQEKGITFDDVAKLWDGISGGEVATIIDEDGLTPFQFIFTPDNSILVINFERSCTDAPRNYLSFFDALTGLPVENRNWNADINEFFALSHDGTRVAIGRLYEPEISVWDIVTQTRLFHYEDDQLWFNYTKLFFSQDDSLLFGVREDFNNHSITRGHVEIWDYLNTKLLDKLEYNEIVNDVILSPNGQILGLIVSDGMIDFNDFTPDHRQILDFTYTQYDFGGFTEKIVLVPNESLLVVLEQQRDWHEKGFAIRLWNYSTGDLLRILSVDDGTDLAISPDGTQMVFGGDALGNITFIDLPNMELERRQVVGLQSIRSVAFNPSNNHQLFIGDSNSWQLGTVENDPDGSWTSQLSGNGPAYAITFSPDGQWMAHASGYNGPVLYDLTNSRTIESPLKESVYNLSAESIAFSPNSKTLITGGKYVYGCGRAGNIQVWSVPDLELLATLEDHTAEVTAVVFSPDGSLLVSSSEDGTIHLRRSDTYEILAILEGHLGYGVNSIAFTPDGRLLISAGDDGTIRLWGISE